MNRGIEQGLHELLQDGRAWVELGTVDSVEEHEAWGYLLTVTLRPSGRQVQTRVMQPSAGDRRGQHLRIEREDEVLVLFPDADQNQGVAIAGLSSRKARVPLGFDNDHVEIVDAGGVKVRMVDQAETKKVVREDLLPDLQSSLQELSAALKGLSIPTPNTDTLVAQLATAYRSASLETD